MKIVLLFGAVLGCFSRPKKNCYWPEPESFRLYDKKGQICPWAKCKEVMTEMDKTDCLTRNQARKFKTFLKLTNFQIILDKKFSLQLYKKNDSSLSKPGAQ